MKRHIVYIITLFYVLGTVGIPLVAYSCVESGEAGVAAYLSESPRDCYAESCCDGDQKLPTDRIQSDIPCCDLNVQVGPENNRIVVPGQRYGQSNPLMGTPACFDASQPDALMASTPPPIAVFHASIKLPLLI